MPNLIEHWVNLTTQDKEYILRAVRRWPRYQRATIGTLPMIDLGAAMLALKEYRDDIRRVNSIKSASKYWLQEQLDAAEIVLAKLPKEPPEERQVVWLNSGG